MVLLSDTKCYQWNMVIMKTKNDQILTRRKVKEFKKEAHNL